MKLSIKPVAFAVTMALGAALAQAQTLPTLGTGTPADPNSNGINTNDGLYLAVWDNASKATELVSLTSVYSDVAIGPTAGGSSILTSPTVGSNGWTQVSNFDGHASVDQLNLGTVANFSSIFSGSSDYAVVAANATSLGVVSTGPLGDTYTGSSFSNMAAGIHGDSASWVNAQSNGPAIDTAGTTAYNVVTGTCSATLCDGTENATGQNFSVNVGTAAGFYNWAKSSSRNPTVTNVYSYNGQQGFFFLSDTGQLTWNLVAAASTVPLPPAVWLFASGLLGLVAIGRRRQSGFGAAA
jgi:hypothetical protein